MLCGVLCSIAVLSLPIVNGIFDDAQALAAKELCCNQGTKYARNHTLDECSSSVPPDVNPEFGSFCIFAMDQCCQDYFPKKQECDRGIEMATKGDYCGASTGLLKDCCNQCRKGASLSKADACVKPLTGYTAEEVLVQDAYESCCKKMSSEKNKDHANKALAPVSKRSVLPSLCEEYAPNELCAHHCIPVPGSYKCECNPGFMLMPDRKNCKELVKNRCKPRNPCQHKCNDNGVTVKCSCRRGYELMADGKSCQDIDECIRDPPVCLPDTECHNVQGSYRCILKKNNHTPAEKGHCPPGFARNAINKACDDVNECTLPHPPCPFYLCENTIGGYKCGGVLGDPVNLASTDKSPPEDRCPPGFKSGFNEECEDVDECVTNKDDCNHISQFCINTRGSFYCQDKVSKHCPPGFKINPITNKCEDIDECEDSIDICRPDQVCVNELGQYDCKLKQDLSRAKHECPEGMRLRQGTTVCEDIDECVEGTHLCDLYQNCLNTNGSHECRCKLGFEQDPLTGACVDVNECATEQHDCVMKTQRCDNTVGSYLCVRFTSCGTGYILHHATGKCEDIDECAVGTHNCARAGPEYRCVNHPGSFRCVRQRPSTTSTTPQPIYEYYYDSDEDITDENEPDAQSSSTTSTPKPTPPSEQLPTVTSTKLKEEIPPEEPKTHTDILEKPEDTRKDENMPTEPTQLTTQQTPIPRPQPEPSSPKPTEPQEPGLNPPDTTSTEPEERNVIYKTFESETKPDKTQDSNEPRPTYSPFSERPLATYQPYQPEEPKPTFRPYQPEEPRPTFRPYQPEKPKLVSDNELVPPEPTEPGLETTYSPVPTAPAVITPPSVVYVDVGKETATVSGEKKDDGSVVVNTKDIPKNEWTKINAKPTNCQRGFESDEYGACYDIDECTTNKHTCVPVTEECKNTMGGYLCVCALGYRRDLYTGTCEVIVTTTSTTTTTEPPIIITTTEKTKSFFWGYPEYRPKPVRPFRPRNLCDAGYHLNSKSGKCEDVNECVNGQANCAAVEVCVNTEGGYRCECPPNWYLDDVKHRCVYNRTNEQFPSGYGNQPVYTPIEPVIPFVEGRRVSGSEVLEPEITKIEDRGTVIRCPWGYRLGDDSTCEDIDECLTGEAKCGPMQWCINLPGGYTCNCPTGHKLVGDHECEDVDECKMAGSLPICSQNADCVNTIGSYQCRCHNGFRSAPVNDKVCVDVDECSENRAGSLCEHRCNNVWGGYRCFCHRGYRLNTDNKTCSDINECEEYKSKVLCVGRCLNEPGSYRCSCPSGYRLSEDKRSCIDIDECETGEASCAGDSCLNTRGGYRCLRIVCPFGYQLESKNRCTKVDRICSPEDWACAHQPSTYSYNYLTFVSNLYIPASKVDLFTMRGPTFAQSHIRFKLRLVSVDAPPSVSSKADINCFLLAQSGHQGVVSLVKPLEGPQSIELELMMELYNHEQFAGIAVAKIFIFVSEYEF